MRKILLSFTGMDGTGKTAHALDAKKYLEAKGFKCSYLWFSVVRMSFLFSFLVIALTWLLSGFKRPATKHVHKNKALVYTWLFSSIFDYALYILLTKLRFFKDALIFDRYVYDLIVRLKFLGVTNERFVRSLLALTPRPDLIFFLDVPPTIASARKKEDPLEYYVLQRKMYTEIMNRIDLNFIILDTTENYHNVNQKIFHYIDLITVVA